MCARSGGISRDVRGLGRFTLLTVAGILIASSLTASVEAQDGTPQPVEPAAEVIESPSPTPPSIPTSETPTPAPPPPTDSISTVQPVTPSEVPVSVTPEPTATQAFDTTAARDDPTATPRASGSSLRCTQTLPVGTSTLDVGDVAEFACAYAAGPAWLRVISLSEQWEYRVDGAAWSTASGSSSLTPLSGDTGQAETFVVQMRFQTSSGPVPSASTGAMVVEIATSGGGALDSGATITLGATVSGASTPSPTACGQESAHLPDIDSSSLEFGTSTWNGIGFPPVTSVLALTITPSNGTGCAGASTSWSVQIRVDSLAGIPGNASIRPGTLTYLGTESGTGAPEWLLPVGTDLVIGAEPVTIASGTGPIDGAGTWNAVFELDPPDDAVPDTFSGAIHISIVVAS